MRAVGTVSRAGREQARTKGECAGAVWQCNWKLAQLESGRAVGGGPRRGSVSVCGLVCAALPPQASPSQRHASRGAAKPTLAFASHWCHAPTPSRSCYHGPVTLVPSGLPSGARVASSSQALASLQGCARPQVGRGERGPLSRRSLGVSRSPGLVTRLRPWLPALVRGSL